MLALSKLFMHSHQSPVQIITGSHGSSGIVLVSKVPSLTTSTFFNHIYLSCLSQNINIVNVSESFF
jgi:hypothetical protein